QQTYLYGNPGAALTKTAALIKEQPKNPYFQELRGDILMKANRPKDAADAYAKAASLDAARSGLLLVSLGQALMAVGTPDSINKAVAQLNSGIGRDKENAVAYRYLAQAYGELGQIPAADLATAEGHFYSADYKNAKIFAMRAQQKLKRGEPRWLRAQDIINYTPSNKLK
ncbi:MAG: M48 family peptidase, partial [Mesorhizobium sp.]